MIGSFLALATRLYRQIHSTDPDVRNRIMDALHDARDSGIIPLGMRASAHGNEYVWVVFDRTRIASPSARADYMRDRTPTGITMTVLDM